MSSTFGAGAAARSEGGGGSLLEGEGGILLEGGGGILLGVDDGDESILPDGGGTNRPDGGAETMRPDGGGTSFPIGGIEGPRDTGALGRDEAASPLRFFSSGKSPSEAGLSLLGEDDVSILNTPRPPDRPCGGWEKRYTRFPIVHAPMGDGWFFRLVRFTAGARLSLGRTKVRHLATRATHVVPISLDSGQVPRCAMIGPWISRRCWKNAGASSGTRRTWTGAGALAT
jgi:hypothetical protein